MENRRIFDLNNKRGINTCNKIYNMDKMNRKETLSTINTACTTSADRVSLVIPMSPLKARISPVKINRACRSQRYLGSVMNRIRGLFKGSDMSSLFCMSQNYQINTALLVIYTKWPVCYTKPVSAPLLPLFPLMGHWFPSICGFV
jgi:hypothetical protein